jgi:Restriction endonuclease
MPLTSLLDQLDVRADVRGRQFEQICAWYMGNAPEYRHRIRRVWLWSEWPGAWAADAGIDHPGARAAAFRAPGARARSARSFFGLMMNGRFTDDPAV